MLQVTDKCENVQDLHDGNCSDYEPFLASEKENQRQNTLSSLIDLEWHARNGVHQERVHTLICSPLWFRGLSHTVSSRDTSRGFAVIQVHPMPGRVAWDGSWTIRTLEPSVMVISPACQSISLTYRSRKLVPRIPGPTQLSTTATWEASFSSFPTAAATSPGPQRRTRSPAAHHDAAPRRLPKGLPPGGTLCPVE
ncbi:conserved hypothetical protein, partial [Trichinella spiralis]|uniref:hypothetical protein n=1 Tax=Trichinella spiralis TaxID=6334 RepID=UPI0001EFD2D9